MFEKERELVELGEHSYNLKEGGEGGFEYINQKGLNIYPGHLVQSVQNISKGTAVFLDRIQDPNWKRFFCQRVKESVELTYKNGRVPSFKGRHHSEETKKMIGSSNSIRQKGERNSQFGTMWITNEQENQKIKKTDPIPEGWKQGRIVQPNNISVV